MEHTGEPNARQYHFTVSWDGVKRVLAYGLATSLMTIGFAFGVASVVHDQTEEDTRNAVTSVVKSVDDTQRLICGILVKSDNPDIRKAVEQYCPPPIEGP